MKIRGRFLMDKIEMPDVHSIDFLADDGKVIKKEVYA